MTARTRLISSASLILVLLLLALAVTVPGHSSAQSLSGTSPDFSPGTSWSLSVGFCSVGDVIVWSWWTSDDLDFGVYISGNSTLYYGFSSWDGFMVSTPGQYNLWWFNKNQLLTATVSYTVVVFTPSLTITSPANGAYLNSTLVSVEGSYDGYANGILVGTDPYNVRSAERTGTSWSVDGLALSEGLNTIQVQSYYILDDYGANYFTISRNVSVRIDSTPPWLSIRFPAQGSFSSEHVVASWQRSDSSGIAKEEVEFDDQGWLNAPSPGYIIDLPNGPHVMRVRITDLAGNQVLKTVSFEVDSAQPYLDIMNPIEGAYVNETAIYSWQTSDNYGVLREEVKLDSSAWIEIQPGFTFDGPDGRHTMSVKVTDYAGNQVLRTVNFTKDTTMPVLSSLSPAPGSYVSDSVVLKWSCSDNYGIRKREIRVDAMSWQEVTADEVTVEVSDGPHTIEVRVTDMAGHAVVRGTDIISDGTPPEIFLLWPEDGKRFTRDSLTLSWTGFDNLSGIDHYEVQISGKQWIDVGNSTSLEFDGLEDMWYFVTVKAIDKSGNSANYTIRFSINTNIWSSGGPYHGLPSHALTALVIAVPIICMLWYWRRKIVASVLPARETSSDIRYYPPKSQ